MHTSVTSVCFNYLQCFLHQAHTDLLRIIFQMELVFAPVSGTRSLISGTKLTSLPDTNANVSMGCFNRTRAASSTVKCVDPHAWACCIMNVARLNAIICTAVSVPHLVSNAVNLDLSSTLLVSFFASACPSSRTNGSSFTSGMSETHVSARNAAVSWVFESANSLTMSTVCLLNEFMRRRVRDG